jgi:hypothetical protein
MSFPPYLFYNIENILWFLSVLQKNKGGLALHKPKIIEKNWSSTAVPS